MSNYIATSHDISCYRAVRCSSLLGETNDVCERHCVTGRWEFTAWRSVQCDRGTHGNGVWRQRVCQAVVVTRDTVFTKCSDNKLRPIRFPPVDNSGSGLATRLRAAVRIPVRARKFFFKMPRPVLWLTQTHSYDTGVLSWGETWPGYEVDHSHPSSAKVKNECSCPSAPHTCVHDVNRQ